MSQELTTHCLKRQTNLFIYVRGKKIFRRENQWRERERRNTE
jgi:hypothetical protein